MADKDFVVKNGIVVNTAFSANSLGIYYSGVQLANTTAANNAGYLGGQLPAYYAVNTTVYSTFAQNTAIYAFAASNSTVYSTFAQNTSVYSTFAQNTAIYAYAASNTYVNSTFQTTAGLNANIASYLPTYPGNINTVSIVNSATFSVGTSWSANSTRVVFGTSVAIQANGSLGTANQVLTTNGSGVYWANGGGTGSTYTKGNQGPIGDASAANNIFRINANTVSNNITFDAQDNASATGPLTIATGYTITISDGASVVIL